MKLEGPDSHLFAKKAMTNSLSLLWQLSSKGGLFKNSCLSNDGFNELGSECESWDSAARSERCPFVKPKLPQEVFLRVLEDMMAGKPMILFDRTTMQIHAAKEVAFRRHPRMEYEWMALNCPIILSDLIEFNSFIPKSGLARHVATWGPKWCTFPCWILQTQPRQIPAYGSTMLYIYYIYIYAYIYIYIYVVCMRVSVIYFLDGQVWQIIGFFFFSRASWISQLKVLLGHRHWLDRSWILWVHIRCLFSALLRSIFFVGNWGHFEVYYIYIT